jgi:ATPase subunit of ABC transporter with duplicated ATPase domains
MIVASGIELRAGARLLLDGASFQVAAGDRVGLVGRNGAGKTTLLKVLAADGLPAAGSIRRSGATGYLPQDPRTGDLDMTAVDRVLSARGLDELRAGLRRAEIQMSDPDHNRADAAIRRYAGLEERMSVLGGYAAEAEAAALSSSLGLPDRVLHQPLGTLSGGQRRRIELARILFGDSQTLLLDEPTNHLDADSITWLRDHLRSYRGGLMVVSHDAGLLEAVVNKVFYLDAQRSVLDYYNLGWKAYLQQRETDERRRKRERANAERQAAALSTQADKMRAKATKARAAQGMQRRAERLLAGLADERAADRVARLRFPVPVPCGRTPLTATGLAKSYGSLEVFSDVDIAVDRGSRVVILGLNGAGKTTLLRLLAGIEPSDTAASRPGTACGSAITPRNTRRWTPSARSWTTCARRRRASPSPSSGRFSGHSCSPGTMWPSPPGCCPAGRRPGSRWPCSSCPAPTCCCWTNRPTTWTRRAGRRSWPRCAPTPGRSFWSPTMRKQLKPFRRKESFCFLTG